MMNWRFNPINQAAKTCGAMHVEMAFARQAGDETGHNPWIHERRRMSLES